MTKYPAKKICDLAFTVGYQGLSVRTQNPDACLGIVFRDRARSCTFARQLESTLSDAGLPTKEITPSSFSALETSVERGPIVHFQLAHCQINGEMLEGNMFDLAT